MRLKYLQSQPVLRDVLQGQPISEDTYSVIYYGKNYHGFLVVFLGQFSKDHRFSRKIIPNQLLAPCC